jgi:hypothetical protein
MRIANTDLAGAWQLGGVVTVILHTQLFAD